MSRRRKLAALGVLGASVLAGASIAPTFAAFTSPSSNSNPNLRAAADWTPPSASRSVIAKSAGGDPGYVKPGGTYYGYAQVADSGNPAAGVASVTVDPGSGAVAATTTGGPWTIGGQTYNYRTAQQTFPSVADGTRSYTIAMSDLNSPVNSQTQNGFSVVVDSVAPTATTVQTANGGSIAGRPEQNDTITFTFSEPIEPVSVLSGWSGASTSVTVRIVNNATADQLQVWNAANNAQLPITSANGVSLGRTDYVSSTRTYTSSTMVRSGNDVTVTLGTASGAGSTAAGNGTMSFAPLATVTDRAGNAASTATATENGAADKEF
jgi:hypothetical protein